MNYPQRLENALRELADFDERIRDRRSAIRKIELRTTLDVASARGEDGKLICSNEKQRDGAIAQTLEENADYGRIGVELAGLERDRADAMASLDALRLEIKLHLLDREHENYLDALKAADAVFEARTQRLAYMPPLVNGHSEIELPF